MNAWRHDERAFSLMMAVPGRTQWGKPGLGNLLTTLQAWPADPRATLMDKDRRALRGVRQVKIGLPGRALASTAQELAARDLPA
jgi:hypothetical protein